MQNSIFSKNIIGIYSSLACGAKNGEGGTCFLAHSLAVPKLGRAASAFAVLDHSMLFSCLPTLTKSIYLVLDSALRGESINLSTSSRFWLDHFFQDVNHMMIRPGDRLELAINQRLREAKFSQGWHGYNIRRIRIPEDKNTLFTANKKIDQYW